MLDDTNLLALCDCGHPKRGHHLAPASPFHGSCDRCNCSYFLEGSTSRAIVLERLPSGRFKSLGLTS